VFGNYYVYDGIGPVAELLTVLAPEVAADAQDGR